MASSPTTLRDVWKAVPVAGQVAVLAFAALLLVATVVRLAQSDTAGAQPAQVATTSPPPSRPEAVYQDGVAIGKSLRLGIPVAPTSGQAALQICERAASIGQSAAQQSVIRDLDQKLDWYRGCAEGVTQVGQAPR